MPDNAIVQQSTPNRGPGIVATLIPARLERLPWGRFHVLVIAALGHHLDSRRARSDARRFGRRRVEGKPDASFLRPARSDSPAAPILAARSSARSISAGSPTGWDASGCFSSPSPSIWPRPRSPASSWNAFTFFLFRFLTGCGHRRRIFRDQLDHPGAHSGALPRPYRSR